MLEIEKLSELHSQFGKGVRSRVTGICCILELQSVYVVQKFVILLVKYAFSGHAQLKDHTPHERLMGVPKSKSIYIACIVGGKIIINGFSQ